MTGSRQASVRNFVGEESAKSRQLLGGLQLQLKTEACRLPTVLQLELQPAVWALPELEHTKAKLNACKDRMDNMDAR